jgi:hypothetical protein
MDVYNGSREALEELMGRGWGLYCIWLITQFKKSQNLQHPVKPRRLGVLFLIGMNNMSATQPPNAMAIEEG